jgi:hypothetical protein
MKQPSPHRLGSRQRSARAFTISEMLIAMTIFIMAIGALVYTQIFALRIYTLAATKLSATRDGRQAMSEIREQIRRAKTLDVGNCTSAGAGSFTMVGGTNVAKGNALQIFPTTNVIPYIIYYLDTSTTTNYLKKYVAAGYATTGGVAVVTNSAVTRLAAYITNQIIFWAEDYRGNVLTNDPRNNRVYRVELQFYQWEYPVAAVGPGNMYDFYQLRSRATRRALD